MGFSFEGTGARISGGTVEHCKRGIVVKTSRHVLKRMTARDNALSGFTLEGNSNKVFHSTANRNGDDGFDLFGDGQQLKDNTANDNRFYGFWVVSDRNQVAKNFASDNDDDGFNVDGARNNLTLNVGKDSDVEHGFDIDGNNNWFTFNSASGNKKNGFSLNDDGTPEFGANNKLIGNKALANDEAGIRVHLKAEDNLLKLNHARDNDRAGGGADDVEDDNPDCDDNVWKFNFFGSANQSCIH